MPANATLFLNRNSGARSSADDIGRAARAAGLEVVEMSPSLDCTAEVRERIVRGIGLFIAAGGDGTVHHVVQGVAGTSASLAVIPAGTYNHFARDLGIPLDWREALDVALHGAPLTIDAGRINRRYFVNNVSIGLYPELVARREERGRDYPRWKARAYALYRALRKFPRLTATVEADAQHELIRTPLFVISNNSYDLEQVGIEASRARMTEGRLSVYWLEKATRLRLAGIVARYLAGRMRAIDGFRSFRTTRIRVQSIRRHLRVGIDGELFTLPTPLVITSMPQALTVRVPQPRAAER